MENLDDLDLTRLHDLTIDEVKSIPMFAHFTDDQAIEVIRTIKRFTEIVVYSHLKNISDGQ